MLYIRNTDQAPTRKMAAGEDIYKPKPKQTFQLSFQHFQYATMFVDLHS